MLTPRCSSSRRAEQGVTLAKIDVDANQGVARESASTASRPVKAFRNGQVVAEFVGAAAAGTRQGIPRRPDQPSLENTMTIPRLRGAEGQDYEGALQAQLTARRTVENAEERNAARELMVQIFQELGRSTAREHLPQEARSGDLLTVPSRAYVVA